MRNVHRPLLAAAATAALAVAPTALAATTYDTYVGKDNERPHGIISFIQFKKPVGGQSIYMDDYFSRCGEFHSGKMMLKHRRFSLRKTWSNGYGMKIDGSVTTDGRKVSGTVRTWGPSCKTPTYKFSAKRVPKT